MRSTAYCMLSKHAVTLMAEQRDGHIVDITSAEVERARRRASVDRSTRWGPLGLSHALHAQLRPQGVKVTASEASGGKRAPLHAGRPAGTETTQRQALLQVAQAVRQALQQPAAVN